MELFKSRTRVAYTNAVGDKVYPVVVDIKKGIKSTEDIQFVSSDVNTGILSVAFISGNENFNVSGADVVCSVMRPDASTLELPCEVVRENIVEVPLGINGTSQDGVYSFDFKVLKGGNKIVGTPIMNYSVSLSIGNDMVVEEDDRLPVLTMLMTQLTELKGEARETINQANTATVASREATANAIEATNNANAVSERVSQETATAISEIKQDTANAIASMEQNTIDAIASMEQNTTDAVSNMTQKTDEAVTMINNNLANVNNVVTTKVAELDNAKSDMTTTVSNKVNEVETRFNALTSSQQQDAEVIDARDGETSLKARLDRDIEKAKQVYVNVEGNHISTDSSVGYLKDVEILGNTIQNASNLADIRSVGDTVEGQELYEIPVLSVGKNLINKIVNGNVSSEGNIIDDMGAKRARTDYIQVDCNKEYRLKNYSENNSIPYVIRFAFDKDKKLLHNGGWNTHYYNNTQVYPQGTKYVIYEFANEIPSVSDININSIKVQLEEGTVATEYEPYQEDKITILSPVQLEKVGDVADRLIEKDGVWGVDKNVGELKLENFDKVSITTTDTTYRVYLGTIINIKTPCNYGFGTSLCNTLPFVQGEYYTRDEEHYYLEDTGDVFLFIDKNKFDGTKEGLNKYLEGKGYVIKYQLATSIFIQLPHDQQVKLRTFANKTNISFGCEIEGTIKAQVPKSLGATVNTHTEQINSLNKELDRVKKLEESTVSTVATESDFTTVEATSNGYFEDVKLEGKTLVNLVDGGNVEKNIGVSIDTLSRYTYLTPLKNNTLYTVILNIDAPNEDLTKLNVSLNGGDLGYINKCINGISCFTLTTDETPHNEIWVYFTNGSTIVGTPKVSNVIVLEGDHTQNPPSFFEGLKSVGQSATTSEDGVDEIVVSSVKGDGNLFDVERLIKETNATRYENGFTGVHSRTLPGKVESITKEIVFEEATQYTLQYNFKAMDSGHGSFSIVYTDGTKTVNYTSGEGIKTVTSTQGKTISHLYFEYSTGSNIMSLWNITLNKGTTPKPYTPYQADKKRLLYYNEETQTWEKPILRQWDSIEKHANGKYYYHQRSGEIVLNGSENWVQPGWAITEDWLSRNPNGFAYETIISIVGKSCDRPVICNKFNSKPIPFSSSLSVGYCTLAENYLSFATTAQSTIDQWKNELQANNVTVVYQLAQEKVYECTNIDLITYANETNYIVESGAIVPRTTLKVHNNISNVVKILQEKVSLLENKFIEGLKQVLAGDMYSLAELLYPEDFVEENPENNIMLLPFE